MVNGNKTNILHLIASGGFAGAERVVLQEAIHIDTSKFNISIGLFTYHKIANTTLKDMLVQNNIKFFCIKMYFPRIYKEFSQILEIIKKNNIHIIHNHGYRATIIGVIAAKLSGIKTVSTQHGWITGNRKQNLYNKLELIFLGFSDLIFCVSTPIKSILEKKRIGSENLVFMPNAVSINILNSNKSLNSNISIGYVGRFSREKGIKYLVDAVVSLSRSNCNLSYIFIGDGPEYNRIKQTIKELKLESVIRLRGFINNIEEIYNEIDILVMPSLSEGLPLTLLEAMSRGIPVVATRVGQIPEVILNNKNGLLVEPKSSKEIVDALRKIVSDQELYSKLSKNAINTVQTRFNLKDRVKRIEEYYNLLTNDKL